MEQKTIIIVVPCYNEQEVLADSNKKLLDLLEQMISDNLISNNSKILYVNDGSKDKTWDLISEYCKEYKYVCGLKLAKNAGHQNALLSGLTIGKDWGDALISIDADLQDDVNVIEEMVDKYHEGCDIVYGVRSDRKTDSFFKRTSAQAFYKLMASMGVKTVYNHADFRLMSRRAVEQFSHYEETNLFLRGIVPTLGYKTDCVYYQRLERAAGVSKYPLSKMLALAFNGISSFSIKPINMILGVGFAMIFVAIAAAIYAIVSYCLGNVAPGWTSLILSIWFIGGLQLLAIGLVGQYIGKVYIEVKHRPRYNIEKVLSDGTEEN